MSVGVDKIREIIENPEEGGHVTEIEVPERVEKEAYDKLKAALANNKPKKGGKGKKGKGKKKKKAWREIKTRNMVGRGRDPLVYVFKKTLLLKEPTVFLQSYYPTKSPQPL